MKLEKRAFRAGGVIMVLMVVPWMTACADKPSAPVGEKPALCSEPWPNFDEWNYNALAKMTISPELQQQYPDLFENGHLKPWDVIGTGQAYEVNSRYVGIEELLYKIGGGVSVGQQMYEDYRNNRTRICGSDH
ncbi:hypothetical protein ACFV4K_14925 [Nocardia sp. NPDC059764]|uniref:hypothetical protein n=1 Tax=Nocardia sp. NPDC059764 TaxID=3346939 RepID=UPI0036698FED